MQLIGQKEVKDAIVLWSLTRRLNWRNESRNRNELLEKCRGGHNSANLCIIILAAKELNRFKSLRVCIQRIRTTLLTTPNESQKARQPRTTSLHISGSPKRVHVPLSIMGALILQNEVAIDDDDHRQLIV
ncbi:MAG: hypothetical protein GY751_01735 [Bacteroidetes bacterium]|nr:hypothetical protein [Bacteroidota bacterium]